MGERTAVDQVRTQLAASTLTLGQLERKTGISQSMLSAVKRGVREPSLDSLVKIAKGLGMNSPELNALTSHFLRDASTSYCSLDDSMSKDAHVKKVHSEVAELLADDLCLYNAFMDITSAAGGNVSKLAMVERYGLPILTKLKKLVMRDVVALNDEEYSVPSETKMVFPAATSLKFMSNCMHRERELLAVNEAEGESRYITGDLSTEGKAVLKKTIEEQFKAVVAIFDQYSKPKALGGDRTTYHHFTSKILQVMLVTFIAFVSMTDNGYAGGSNVGGHGGGTDPSIRGVYGSGLLGLSMCISPQSYDR